MDSDRLGRAEVEQIASIHNISQQRGQGATSTQRMTAILQVVLAAAVTNRAGKLIVSRNFVEMTRMRIEGLLTAFPKLLDGAGESLARL